MNIKAFLMFAGRVALALFAINLIVNIVSRYTGGGSGSGSGFLQKLLWLPDTFIPLPGANNPDGTNPKVG